jgi:hypothetical protein
MTSFGGSSGSGGSTSSQATNSYLIRSMYSHYNHIQSTTNIAKFIKQYGLFKFEEDTNTTLWYVSSPLDLAPTTTPLQKLKYHFPKFSVMALYRLMSILLFFQMHAIILQQMKMTLV